MQSLIAWSYQEYGMLLCFGVPGRGGGTVIIITLVILTIV